MTKETETSNNNRPTIVATVTGSTSSATTGVAAGKYKNVAINPKVESVAQTTKMLRERNEAEA